MEGRLKESFSEQVIKNLKLCLPKQHWEHSCIKYDTREKTDKPCGFYLSSKFAPTLAQNYENISLLIKNVYDGDMKDLDKWLENYKNCTISWYVLTNKKGKVELSIYFNTSGRLMDFIENRMFDIRG
jgi:hypothetical protein